MFTYTDTGQLATETNYLGTTSYIYDSRDRLTRQDNPDGSFLAYTYDGNGNRLTVETGAGTTTYTYDELDRLDTVTDPDSGLTDYDYDEVGNMAQTVHPNGTITTYVYDDLNRLLNLTTTDSLSNVLTSFVYTLDNVGNRLQIAELSRTVDYDYDDLYRLTQEAVTDATNGNVTFDFTYDKVGNRLTRSVDSVLTDSYVYDDNDRVVSAGASSFTYDSNGNTQTEVSGRGLLLLLTTRMIG